MSAFTPGQQVTVSERGQHGTDTWRVTYLRDAATGWCDVLRYGKIFRVPVRLVAAA